jgi:hypothetical protein
MSIDARLGASGMTSVGSLTIGTAPISGAFGTESVNKFGGVSVCSIGAVTVNVGSGGSDGTCTDPTTKSSGGGGNDGVAVNSEMSGTGANGFRSVTLSLIDPDTLVTVVVVVGTIVNEASNSSTKAIVSVIKSVPRQVIRKTP